MFELNGNVKTQLARIVHKLYDAAPQCFCEKLVSGTFHVTLHDLSNAAKLADVSEKLFENELKIIKKLGELKAFKDVRIKMKSNCIFNMLNTSLVLGLYPADESEYAKLMSLYYIMDDVVSLSYPLTPHVTLAYYNVNGFDTTAAKALETIVNTLNADDLPNFELSVGKLFYQKFQSMNDYINVINLGAAHL